MNSPLSETPSTPAPSLPNGSGAAAILSAGIGCFVFAILAFAGDKSAAFKNSLIFYRPTGALSGVSILAVLAWLLVWGILEWRWRKRDVALGPVNTIAFLLLALSLLLTFPPIVDIL